MKAVDIAQIIQVAGPLLIELVELLLRHWGAKREEDIVDAAYTFLTWGEFEDEHGVRFTWEPRTAGDEREAAEFLRLLVVSKATVMAEARRGK